MKFKSKYLVFIFIICILFSIAAVSANDNQTDAQNLNPTDEIGINDNGKLMDVANKSYDDFYDDIKDCTDTFNIKNNYVYRESDNRTQLVFNQSKIVINGNNHVIDGANTALGFAFLKNRVDITINDLTFINCDQPFAGKSGNLTLNNVNFTSNFNSKVDGAIITFGEGENMILDNCNFNSNANSSLIIMYHGDVVICNSRFCNTHAVGVDAPILVNRNSLVIENCTFENLSSKYWGAVNFKGDYLSVKNSKFINTHAQMSGGAIVARYFAIPMGLDAELNVIHRPSEDWLIENTEFLNVSSAQNGGALYTHMESGYENVSKKTLHITNCNFTDSTSAFGGAIGHQDGFLDISNTNFINSKAGEIGGAIYTSWANLTLTGCNVINSSAGSNAAAIYFDNGKLIIDRSNLTNNKVNAIISGNKAVIYANDVDADIRNSTFDNGGIAIYANFAANYKISDIDSTDLFLMNNANYTVSVENKGIRLNLVGNSIVADKLPSRFDLRDWGWVSPLKFQEESMACWAFATVAAVECSLLKATGVLYNLSEDNLYNLELKYYRDGDARITDVGFAYSGLGYLLSWRGPVSAQDDPFDERGMFSEVVQADERIHLQDAMIIFGARNDTADLIKQAIMKYGPVTIGYSIMPFDYNQTNYTDKDLQPGHFVPIIGWDDNYPAENFIGTSGVMFNPPKTNGAWLIKDSESPDLNESEGTYMGDAGFIWIPYENPSLLAKDLYAIIPQAAGVAYIFENTNDYHVNYQTDLVGLAGFDGSYTYYSNEFTSKYSELIGAVGTYFNESGIDYSFDVYVNGAKVHTQSGISEFAGFRTIVLDRYIPVKEGDKFKVVFKNNALPFQAYSRQHYVAGMSFVSKDGNSWEDITLENRTVCLKVYTLADDTKITDNNDISVDYTGGKYFSVKVVTADGHAVGAGASVNFLINGKTTTVKTDSNGIAMIKITQTPGKYTIKTTYNGLTASNKVTVNHVLTASKGTVKKTAKKFTLKAKLKVNGKLIKGKKITFKFKGKKYTVKTNKNGIAQKTFNKKFIKKLKKGKTYAVKVIYLKDTIKTTVKVR